MRTVANSRWLLRLTLIVGVLLIAGGLYHQLDGRRYTLYLTADVRACWQALQVITASTAARFRRAEGPRRRDDGLVETTLDYEIGNVFASTLPGSIVCVLRPDADRNGRVVEIRIGGEAVDPATLEVVNAALAGD